ncbi:DnaJ sub C member 8 [Yamadazyma tenuis]|uniref:J domain-containing protein n=1 Tax=Candida tenuis (strain ATCC 10573 / BCRC 21748 / CBS 615 / JCM 9827 / NBRC 10315 / NRRL Y-1498 / VKM Y-70) TaxID=590646 RepID=G3B7Z5_CANTC|nr:uncharacterized protein CANTEDRAFT_94578 [Yamadazyma tenuis ATCC 10573]EGV62485.1 hypothetical protein CANTEDRAFT_94578 [Yamadazyma tenuis ATCC 10573]WEJ92921.1 DnaJ sub C member 8 [Yamadazyma tenuis]
MAEDIDKYLSSTERESVRDREIARIISCHIQDSFHVLDLDPADTSDLQTQVKKAFRKKSLLVHPDKTDHKDAPTAFDRLKRAQAFLSDDGEQPTAIRQKLVDIYAHIRQNHSGDISVVRKKVAEILEEDKRLDNIEQEQQDARDAQLREEQENRKQEILLKREMASKWEDSRDSRVANWRSFVNKVDKKKKKKKKVLA